MRSYYAHGPDRHHSGAGVPPAAYATPYPPNIPQGYPPPDLPHAGASGAFMHPHSFASPFSSLLNPERLLAPLYGIGSPTILSPMAGPGQEPPVFQGGTVIQSFTQTSHSSGGMQTTYSVSSVSCPNDQGGIDVYRTRTTTVCAPTSLSCASRIFKTDHPVTDPGRNQFY